MRMLFNCRYAKFPLWPNNSTEFLKYPNIIYILHNWFMGQRKRIYIYISSSFGNLLKLSWREYFLFVILIWLSNLMGKHALRCLQLIKIGVIWGIFVIWSFDCKFDGQVDLHDWDWDAIFWQFVWN